MTTKQPKPTLAAFDPRADILDEIRSAQRDARALSHLGRLHPDTRLSDPAVSAQIDLLIQRLQYAIEYLKETPPALIKERAAIEIKQLSLIDAKIDEEIAQQRRP